MLRDDLRAGNVFPWDRLTEKTISEHFQVSRTPVRESIARLVAEGLLQKHPDGFGLVLPDADTLAGLYEARLALELQGIRRVAAGAGVHDIDRLKKITAEWEVIRDDPPEPGPRLVALDEKFHCGLLAAAGEPALVSVLRHVNDRTRALRMYGYLASDRLARAAADHLEIAGLLLEARFEEAQAALTRHITDSRHAALARALHGSPATGFTRDPSYLGQPPQ